MQLPAHHQMVEMVAERKTRQEGFKHLAELLTLRNDLDTEFDFTKDDQHNMTIFPIIIEIARHKIGAERLGSTRFAIPIWTTYFIAGSPKGGLSVILRSGRDPGTSRELGEFRRMLVASCTFYFSDLGRHFSKPNESNTYDLKLAVVLKSNVERQPDMDFVNVLEVESINYMILGQNGCGNDLNLRGGHEDHPHLLECINVTLNSADRDSTMEDLG